MTLLAVLSGCLLTGGASTEGQFSLYSTYPVAEVWRALANGPGAAHEVKVSVVQKPMGELLAQVKAVANNPKADI